MGDRPGIVVVGASRGFGAALARDLADTGYPVVAGARSGQGPSGNLHYQQVDVTDDYSIRRFFGQARELVGVPGGLVFCPSNSSAVHRAWEIPASEAQRVIDATLVGFTRCARRVVPDMVDAGRGSVLAVGSRAAREPVDLLAAYCSAKAGLEHYIRCLARELAPTGVRANAIGITAETNLAQAHRAAKERLRGRTSSHSLLPDVADSLPLARFLLSDEARHLTGQIIEARQPTP